MFPADPPSGSLPQGARTIAQYDGIAWTGSSLTVFEPGANCYAAQIEFARAAFEAKVPSFGSCWAAQIAVVAAGGSCRTQSRRGVKCFSPARSASLGDGRAHPLYRGKKGDVRCVDQP